MKIFTIIGARPQFIKSAPVSRAFSEAGISESIIHTGQHFDAEMSDIFFDELGIPEPAHHLGVSGDGHGAMTGAILQALEPLLQTEQPDWVLVYGDTNSTLAGALAASKLHIPVAHVEAGLRSFNRRMPEEQNRVVTDHLADILFTPTDTATARLKEEGIPDYRVHQVGDVMYDATLFYAGPATARSSVLAVHDLVPKEYILATVHRAENTDQPARLGAIMEGLESASNQVAQVILPLHPRTRSALTKANLIPKSLKVIDPVGYLDMVVLQRNAQLIATDSGGIQKEAYFNNVPCITLRDETEWPELIDLGVNRLVGSNPDEILKGCKNPPIISTNKKPFGDGFAAPKIAKTLMEKNDLSYI